MPKQNPDAEIALRKLGRHLRQSFAKKHPIPEKSLETVRHAVREQWDKEQEAKRHKKAEPDEPQKRDRREPPEPDQDR
jgi:hypothetical protein